MTEALRNVVVSRRYRRAVVAGRGVRYARKRLDLSPKDIARGLSFCAGARTADRLSASVAAAWQPSEAVVATLSVRSGFDLLLGAVDWPPGSEVVFTAVTIPHLATLVRSHGFVPVAVDLCPETLEVDPAVLEAACTERTRALVIAQLFGVRSELTPHASIAAARGLLLIEDCAQCYDGITRRLGRADVEMYSFGTIKTATCVGGAVLLVRDPALRSRIRTRQDALPIQPTAEYVGKLLKAALLLVLGTPSCFRVFSAMLDAVGVDYDLLIRKVSREFDDQHLLARIRRRPCTALLAMMDYRFVTYQPGRVVARGRAGDQLAAQLAPHVLLLGRAARSSTHWLFPIVSSAPLRLIAVGRSAGYDLTDGSSTLVALDENCRRAADAMSNVVYAPVDAAMPPTAVNELATLINGAESAVLDSSPSA